MKSELPMQHASPEKQSFENFNILDELKIDQAFRLAQGKLNCGKAAEAKQIYSDILIKFPKNKKALKALKSFSNNSLLKQTLSTNPPEEALQHILNLFNTNEVQQALTISLKFLEKFPNSALLHNFCGICNATLNQLDIAILAYKNALSIQPGFIDAHYNLGVASKANQDFKQAEMSYMKVLKLAPNHVEALNNLGGIYLDQQNFEKALNYFNQAIANNSKHLEANFNRANALRDSGQLKIAITAYEKVLELNADFPLALTSLGEIFKRQGKLKEAIKLYQKALDIDPQYPEAYFLLGNALCDLDQSQKALENYKTAIKFKADYADAWGNMADIYVDRNDFKKALISYEAAIDLDPDCAGRWDSLGSARRQNNELEEAIKSYKKALELDPERVQTYSNLAIALNDVGEQKKAITTHEIAIQKNPKSAAGYLNFGLTLENNAEVLKATNMYKKALKLDPDYALAHANLGFMYLFQGNLQLAVEHRKWRWKTEDRKNKLSHLNLPEWDGKQSLKGKRVLAFGEQGPGDIIIWAPGIEYLKSLGCRVTLQCHAKLIELFEMSFSDIEIKQANSKKTIGIEDYDYYIPMETLFGYFCISEQKRDKSLNFSAPAQFKTDAFLFPKQERIDFWKGRLNEIGKGPFVGISWKSPVVTYSRKRNYTELSDWKPLFSLPNITLINLQSKAFEDDILEIKKKYSVDVHNFDDLDHYDDFADVAALCAALNMCVSVSTAVSTLAAAVGTPTHMLHWRMSSWNNVLFSPPGPNVKIYERNSWEPWTECFTNISNEILACSTNKL